MRRWVAFGAVSACVPAFLATVDPPHGPTPKAPRAEAAVVLSGDVDFLRVRRAAALYAEGAVQAVVLTGSGIGGDSAAVLRREALGAGVPAAAIVLEEGSRSTRENLLGVAPLLREHGWRSAALVTSASHMARAARTARRALPEVEWIAVPVPDAGPSRRILRTRLQEWVKLGVYAFRGWI